jgi:hypothetical protein
MCMCKQTAAVSCASILSKHTECTCSRHLSGGQLQGGNPDAPPIFVSHTNMQQVCLCYCQSCVTPSSRPHQNRTVQTEQTKPLALATHRALVAAWCTHQATSTKYCGGSNQHQLGTLDALATALQPHQQQANQAGCELCPSIPPRQDNSHASARHALH